MSRTILAGLLPGRVVVKVVTAGGVATAAGYYTY
jgi:hypothetical protein